MVGLSPLHHDSPLIALRDPASTHDPGRSYRGSGGITTRSLPSCIRSSYAVYRGPRLSECGRSTRAAYLNEVGCQGSSSRAWQSESPIVRWGFAVQGSDSRSIPGRPFARGPGYGAGTTRFLNKRSTSRDTSAAATLGTADGGAFLTQEGSRHAGSPSPCPS